MMIGRLADALLTRVVPQAPAVAATCTYRFKECKSNIATPCHNQAGRFNVFECPRGSRYFVWQWDGTCCP